MPLSCWARQEPLLFGSCQTCIQRVPSQHPYGSVPPNYTVSGCLASQLIEFYKGVLLVRAAIYLRDPPRHESGDQRMDSSRYPLCETSGSKTPYPEGPSIQYLRMLLPTTMTCILFGTRSLGISSTWSLWDTLCGSWGQEPETLVVWTLCQSGILL